MDREQFTRMMLPHALAVSKKTGIDPRLVIAQSALETGYGRSAPNNNYFGIKSHGKGGATMATNEVINGQTVRINDSFRTYGDPGQSAADYGDFLTRNPRYKGVLAETTLQGQIDAMGRSGYATDPNYAAKLSSIANGLPIDDGMMIGAETMAALGRGPAVNMLPQGESRQGVLAPQGGQGVTRSTQGAPMTPEQPRRPSIWDKIGGPLADPDRRARLAMALEGLTLNPNQGVIEGAKAGIEQRAEEKRVNRTVEWLRSQGRDDLAQAVAQGIIGGSDAFGVMQKAQAGAQDVQYGLSPQPFVREDGSIGMGVLGNNGTFKEIELPQGAEIAKGVDKVDAGDRWILMDKFGNKVGEQMKNLEAAAGATAFGAATGKARGEDSALLESTSSKLPGLEGVVQQLEKLADEATYTIGGQFANEVGKQFGAEPTRAAIARAEYIAMVDNQVLPMLRDTFGAAFTVKEGETLRATLGDQDKSPAEKKAVLRAFIEQKKRDVAALAARTGGAVPQPATPAPVRKRYNPETGALE